MFVTRRLEVFVDAVIAVIIVFLVRACLKDLVNISNHLLDDLVILLNAVPLSQHLDAIIGQQALMSVRQGVQVELLLVHLLEAIMAGKGNEIEINSIYR